MNQDLSIVNLILHASWVVQAVVAMLVGISIASWAAIFRKIVALRRVAALNEEFDRDFWSGTSLNELFAAATQNARGTGPMERIFASGMREYQKLRERRVLDTGALLDGARRAMRASYQRELDGIESNLSFLATVGSVSPYIGLFGTVWGIMHAFTGLAALEQVTLASVAPGIAEALVATAIGLFAAIPAVVAYNRFAHDIDRVANKLETFIDVMLVLLIIFMVTAPLITPSMIALPRVGKAPGQPPKPIEVLIDKNDVIQIKAGGEPVTTQLSEVGNAVKRLQPAVPQGEQPSPVVISADKSIKYETVVDVMDSLQRAGVLRVGLSVQSGKK